MAKFMAGKAGVRWAWRGSKFKLEHVQINATFTTQLLDNFSGVRILSPGWKKSADPPYQPENWWE